MSYFECAIVFALIFPIVSEAEADQCKNKRLTCYECDSRIDAYCDAAFNKSLPSKPQIKVCDGCCVTFFHKLHGMNEDWVQRSCTEENAIINYFLVEVTENCTKHRENRGKICFCGSNFCNGALPKDQSSLKREKSLNSPPSTSSPPPIENSSETSINFGISQSGPSVITLLFCILNSVLLVAMSAIFANFQSIFPY